MPQEEEGGFKMPNCADQDVGSFDIGMEDERWLMNEPPAVEPCPLCCMKTDDSRRVVVENIMREEVCGFRERCMKALGVYEAIRASCGDAAPAAANLATIAVHANDHDIDLAGQQARHLAKLTSVVKHMESFLHPVSKDAYGKLRPIMPPFNVLKEYLNASQRRYQLLVSMEDQKRRRLTTAIRS